MTAAPLTSFVREDQSLQATAFLQSVRNEYSNAVAHLASSASKEMPRANEAHCVPGPETEGATDFAVSISRLCHAMATGHGRPDGIKFASIEGKSIELQSDQCRRATLIVAELVDNACRTGALGAGPIAVTAGHRGGWIFCSVSSDRTGNQDRSSRQGTHAVDSLAAGIKEIVARRMTPSQVTVTLLFDAYAPQSQGRSHIM